MNKINIFDDGGEELQFEESLVRTELKLLGPIFIIFLSFPIVMRFITDYVINEIFITFYLRNKNTNESFEQVQNLLGADEKVAARRTDKTENNSTAPRLKSMLDIEQGSGSIEVKTNNNNDYYDDNNNNGFETMHPSKDEMIQQQQLEEDQKKFDVNTNFVYSKSHAFSHSAMLRGLIPDSCGTYFITVVKIFLLHWLQPFLYVLLIYAYYDEINHIQRTCAITICLREGLYFLLTLWLLVKTPSFLFINDKSKYGNQYNKQIFSGCDISWKHNLFLYTFTPHIYLYETFIIDDIDERSGRMKSSTSPGMKCIQHLIYYLLIIVEMISFFNVIIIIGLNGDNIYPGWVGWISSFFFLIYYLIIKIKSYKRNSLSSDSNNDIERKNHEIVNQSNNMKRQSDQTDDGIHNDIQGDADNI